MTRKVIAAVIHPMSIANCHGTTNAVPLDNRGECGHAHQPEQGWCAEDGTR